MIVSPVTGWGYTGSEYRQKRREVWELRPARLEHLRLGKWGGNNHDDREGAGRLRTWAKREGSGASMGSDAPRCQILLMEWVRWKVRNAFRFPGITGDPVRSYFSEILGEKTDWHAWKQGWEGTVDRERWNVPVKKSKHMDSEWGRWDQKNNRFEIVEDGVIDLHVIRSDLE